MILQGKWRSMQATSTYGKRPEVGSLVASDFQAWRVVRVADLPQLDTDDEVGRYQVEVRPLDKDGHEGAIHHTEAGPRTSWPILPEHYAVCGRCGDVVPCREVYAEAQGEAAMKELRRFDQPGVCPACQEIVTSRQKSITLPNIIAAPIEASCTFHLRSRCRWSAAQYEQRVVKAQGGTARLTCSGHLIQHVDGTLECLNLDCPNIEAIHSFYSQCQYRSHGCPRLECQLGIEGIA